jgi:hypothetical protein
VTQLRNGAHALWRVLIAIFAAATVVQVFLAGYGIFNADDEGKNKKFEDAFSAHGGLGFFLTVGSLLILIVALIAWRDRRTVGASAVLFGLLVLQNVLAGLGKDHPIIGAFHPLNGFLILGLSGWLASRAWGHRRMRHDAPARAKRAPPPA